MQIVSCVKLWLTCLFLFIMVEFKSCYIAHLKTVLIFFVPKVFQKGTINVLNEFVSVSHEILTRFYGSLSVYNRPLPSEKIAPWQPS